MSKLEMFLAIMVIGIITILMAMVVEGGKTLKDLNEVSLRQRLGGITATCVVFGFVVFVTWYLSAGTFRSANSLGLGEEYEVIGLISSRQPGSVVVLKALGGFTRAVEFETTIKNLQIGDRCKVIVDSFDHNSLQKIQTEARSL